MIRHWYAVRVPPNRERWAQRVIEDAGYATYLPTEPRRATRRHQPRCHGTLDKPLYGGHVFTGVAAPLLDDLPTWADLAALRAYRGVLGMGARPAAIDYAEIHRWAQHAGQAGILKRSVERLRKGQIVRFTEGAFESLPATVIDILEDGYAIEFRFLGTLRRAIARGANIEAV